MINKWKAAAAAVAGLLSLPSLAGAADLPTRKAPAPPAPYAAAPVFTWTGGYIGGYGGGNWSQARYSDVTGGPFGGLGNLNTNGPTFGALAGYNWGWGNSFLIGIEGEAGFDQRHGTGSFARVGGVDGFDDSGKFIGRLRGRVGYSIGNVLFFVAGGGSVGDLKLSMHDPLLGTQEIDHWLGGYNIGGGVEYAFWNNWTIRGEYIYDRFSNARYGFNAQNPAGFDSQSVRFQESTARAVLSYKF